MPGEAGRDTGIFEDKHEIKVWEKLPAADMCVPNALKVEIGPQEWWVQKIE